VSAPDPISDEKVTTAPDVLSQNEVERLVAQVQAEEATAPVIKPGGLRARLKNEEVQAFDFRQPSSLAGSELRRLRLRHEGFIRALAAHFSTYLRLEVAMQMQKLQTLNFGSFIEGLASPTHLTLFKVEPLRGVCLLDMSPRLGLTIADRLLGGPAQGVTATGDLSDIETALLDQVVLIVLSEWCQLWNGIENAQPIILGHENNGRFVSAMPNDAILLVLSIEVRLGDCVEQMQLALPFLTIEPLIRHNERAGDTGQANAAAKQDHLSWNPSFDDVRIRLNTIWQGLELSARALVGLKKGDLLMLDAKCFDQVEVCLEDVPRFHGRLGTSGDKWAVELADPLKT
jgi:flagellar motor switch protein FliM